MGQTLPIPSAGTLPQIAALADTGFALAWTAPRAGGDTDVFTQLFIEVFTERKNV